MNDIEIRIRIEGGRRETVTAPLDMQAEAFLNELLLGLKIDLGVNGNRRLWMLVDPATGQALQAKRSIRENHVHEGQELLLQEGAPQADPKACPNCGREQTGDNQFCLGCGTQLREPDEIAAKARNLIPEQAARRSPDIKFLVYLENGSDKEFQLPSEFLGRELLAQVLGSSPSSLWTLYNKDTGSNLDLARSLAENGVQHGHSIYLRKIEVPAEIRKPDLQKVQPKKARWKLISLIVVCVLVVAAVVFAVMGRLSSVVAVSPVSAEVAVRGQQQFSATVGGKPGRFAWSIAPQTGTIDAKGLYVAPRSNISETTIAVTAAVEGDSSKSATSHIKLLASHDALVVSPATASLAGAETATFSAASTNGGDGKVTWSVEPAVGSITQDGVYTAPVPVGDVAAVDVKATSISDPGQSTTSHVTLEPVAIALRPRNATVSSSSTLRIFATLTGTPNHGIRWSLSGPGAISREGVYAAPSDITEPRTALVTATSSADVTKSATLSVKITPVVAVKLAPASGSLVAGQHERFTATVSGTPKTGVRWSLSGPGTLSQDGAYDAPTSLSSEQTARVTAVSEADPTKSEVATITVRPMVIMVSPNTQKLRAFQTTRFTASSNAGGTPSVRWSLTGKGSLSRDGLYTAPISVTADQLVLVVATSTTDPSRSATAVVALLRDTWAQSGTLIWSGTTDKDGLVTIDGSAANRGMLRGDVLPGVPVMVRLDNKDFTVVQSPDSSSGWKRFTFSCKKAKNSAQLKISWNVLPGAK